MVAIKIAPFNRYQTLDVVRAVAESGRDDIALYTGNDDNIVARSADAVSLPRTGDGRAADRRRPARPLGGLDAQGRRAARRVPRASSHRGAPIPVEMLRRNVEVTDANAAFFDAANGFAGCIPGLHEVLRRPGAAGRASGASTRTRRSAPASAKRSTASAAPTRTWPMTSSSRSTAMSGSTGERLTQDEPVLQQEDDPEHGGLRWPRGVLTVSPL